MKAGVEQRGMQMIGVRLVGDRRRQRDLGDRLVGADAQRAHAAKARSELQAARVRPRVERVDRLLREPSAARTQIDRDRPGRIAARAHGRRDMQRRRHIGRAERPAVDPHVGGLARALERDRHGAARADHERVHEARVDDLDRIDTEQLGPRRDHHLEIRRRWKHRPPVDAMVVEVRQRAGCEIELEDERALAHAPYAIPVCFGHHRVAPSSAASTAAALYAGAPVIAPPGWCEDPHK